MVSIRAAVFALFVGSAFGQFPSPLIVAPPANTDPSCVRLYEQRTNGNNFISFCAPNALTATTAITLRDLSGATFAVQNYTNTFSAVQTFAAAVTVSGVQNNATASSPWNDFYANRVFSESYRIANPGSVFATSWNLKYVGTNAVEFVDTVGTSRFKIDPSAGVAGTVTVTGDLLPGPSVGGFVVGTAANPWAQMVANEFSIGTAYGIVLAGDGYFNDLITGGAIFGSVRVDASGNGFFNNVTVSGTCTGCGGGGGVSSLSASSPIAVSASTGAVNITCSTCVVSGSSPSFASVTMSATLSGFTQMSGDMGSGNVIMRTLAGAPGGCGSVASGWFAYDTTNHKFYVCDGGTPYFITLAP